MIEAARAKAQAAIAATGLPVGMASEGACGPHPVIPLLARGQEILLWHDSRTEHEFIEHLVDDAPTYDQIEVTQPTEAHIFLSRIGFPTTAVSEPRRVSRRLFRSGLYAATGRFSIFSLHRASASAGGHVADRLEQAAVVEPVGPLRAAAKQACQRSCGLQQKAEGERGEFDRVAVPPWSTAPDDLGLEQANHGLGEGIDAPMFVKRRAY